MRPAMSAYRQEILTALKENKNPLDAQGILKRLSGNPDLSTLYRALNYLLSQNLIKSVSFFDQRRFYYACHQSHCHFLYCTACREVNEFHRCAAEKIQKQVEEESGYMIQDHFFYFTGLCASCKELPRSDKQKKEHD